MLELLLIRSMSVQKLLAVHQRPGDIEPVLPPLDNGRLWQRFGRLVHAVRRIGLLRLGFCGLGRGTNYARTGGIRYLEPSPRKGFPDPTMFHFSEMEI